MSKTAFTTSLLFVFHILFLIDFFHLVHLLVGAFDLLKGGEVISVGITFIDGETELDHAMDTSSELGRLLETEARGEQGGVEKQPDKILNGLVGLVGVTLALELSHDRMLGVDLHGFLGNHVGGHGGITEGLSLHDTFHVGGPAELGSDESARGVGETSGHLDLLDLLSEHLLDEGAQSFEVGLELLGLLLVLLIIELETFLGDGLKLLAIIFLDLLDGVLIDRIDQVENLEALLLQAFQERRSGNALDGLAGDVVDIFLAFLHAIDVLLQGDGLLAGLGGLVAKEISDLGTVGGILMDTELQVLAELLVELHVVILVLGDLVEELKALLDEVLLDDAEDLVLLERLTRDVQRKIFGIDNTLDEGEPLRDDVLAVVHDEDTTHVQLDVVALLLAFEHVERGTAGGEQERFELELAFHGEVLDGEVVLPVVGDGLVESAILFGGDVIGLAHPDGLLLVELFPLVGHLLDLLGLLFLFFGFFGFINLFDLWLITIFLLFAFLFGFLLLFGIGVSDFLFGALLTVELDRETDELGMLLDEVLKAALLEVLGLILLHVKNDLGTALDFAVSFLVILGDGERTTSGGLPDVLFVIDISGDDGHLVGNQVGRVETDTELANHRNITALVHGLHESLGARFGDRSEVVHQVGLGHTNTGVLDGQGVVGLIRKDLNVEVWLRLDLLWVRDGLVADLVQSIGRVGDQLAKKHLLV